MSDLLTEKELLRVLDRAWKHDEPSSVFAQAYAQLVKIVEEYFSEPMQVDEDCPSKEACVYYLPGTLGPNCLYVEVDEELVEKITELADSCVGTDIDMQVDGFDLDEFKQELRELLTQKRVSREWVVEQYNEQFDMKVIWSGAIDFVIHILKELGIEVEE